ncbi:MULTISPECIES: hypothetical protein [Bacillus cereus group]|uniref:Rad50/SbcC-type AAA domain-containing protein n=1 Tax=Bacillus cereus (strain G9842) TaxID=405531 RepID=B7ITB5_BACC2|nr:MULTISPECIES: hypothetical protein [Bacillus cereus group]ACK95877.1 hypothetical protein BCG9842_B3325 [Bacillus cereus G9842]MDR4135370.1 hypothetical protein [Bacillus cereus]MDR4367554.1 hypothetical protein [Bacillus cereus]PDZ35673.1 hypothetical protein CON68_01885 [Bacillus toyonensis]
MNKKVKINKLIIEGDEYKRTITFDESLTIISGDGWSGKSLVLKLIDYCLGKRDKFNFNVQEELGLYCNEVYLEIELPNQKVTILRSLKKNHTKIYLYYSTYDERKSYLPKVIDYGELGDILFGLLDIPIINRIKSKAKSNEKTTERLSFRDIMRFAFIPQQELGTNIFLKNNDKFTSYKNTPTFELIHNLLNPDANSINEEIANTTNLIEKCKKDINTFQQYLDVRDAGDIIQLQEAIDELNSKIEDKKSEKQEYVSAYKEANEKQSSMYEKLKQETLEVVNKKKEILRKKRDLNVSLTSKEELMTHYQEELKQLSATVEVMHLVKIENHIKNCPLCNSELIHKDEDIFDYNLTDQLRKQLEGKIKILDNTIALVNEKINDLEKEHANFEDREKVLSIALEEYTQKISIPNFSEIEVINRIIIELDSKLNSYKELVGIHKKIRQLEIEKEEYKKKLGALEVSLQSLLNEVEDEEVILEFLNKKYIELLQKFKYPATAEKAYIDEQSYMPWYNNASVFSHDSGGLLMSIQLSYLGAILLWKSKFPERQNHPGFLLLDSLSKYMGTNSEGENADTLDPESYKAIYEFLIELSEHIQIIVVENTPPPFVQKYNKYKFYRTEMRGLINPRLNEK